MKPSKSAQTSRRWKNCCDAKGPGLVFAMIQKYREKDVDSEGPSVKVHASRSSRSMKTTRLWCWSMKRTARMPNQMHAHLLATLLTARAWLYRHADHHGGQKRTHAIFGEFLDRYDQGIGSRWRDGADPVRRTQRGRSGGRRGDLDQLFDRWFQDRPEDEREAIRKKVRDQGAVLGEAEELIAAKADDMMRHYIEHILPNQLKAQLVAFSRLAAVFAIGRRFHCGARQAGQRG